MSFKEQVKKMERNNSFLDRLNFSLADRHALQQISMRDPQIQSTTSLHQNRMGKGKIIDMSVDLKNQKSIGSIGRINRSKSINNSKGKISSQSSNGGLLHEDQSSEHNVSIMDNLEAEPKSKISKKTNIDPLLSNTKAIYRAERYSFLGNFKPKGKLYRRSMDREVENISDFPEVVIEEHSQIDFQDKEESPKFLIKSQLKEKNLINEVQKNKMLDQLNSSISNINWNFMHKINWTFNNEGSVGESNKLQQRRVVYAKDLSNVRYVDDPTKDIFMERNAYVTRMIKNKPVDKNFPALKSTSKLKVMFGRNSSENKIFESPIMLQNNANSQSQLCYSDMSSSNSQLQAGSSPNITSGKLNTINSESICNLSKKLKWDSSENMMTMNTSNNFHNYNNFATSSKHNHQITVAAKTSNSQTFYKNPSNYKTSNYFFPIHKKPAKTPNHSYPTLVVVDNLIKKLSLKNSNRKYKVKKSKNNTTMINSVGNIKYEQPHRGYVGDDSVGGSQMIGNGNPGGVSFQEATKFSLPHHKRNYSEHMRKTSDFSPIKNKLADEKLRATAGNFKKVERKELMDENTHSNIQNQIQNQLHMFKEYEIGSENPSKSNGNFNSNISHNDVSNYYNATGNSNNKSVNLDSINKFNLKKSIEILGNLHRIYNEHKKELERYGIKADKEMKEQFEIMYSISNQIQKYLFFEENKKKKQFVTMMERRKENAGSNKSKDFPNTFGYTSKALVVSETLTHNY